MAHSENNYNIEERYEMSSKTKNMIFGSMGLGAVLVILGLFMQQVPVEHNGSTENVFAWSRFWANFLLSAFFFTAISVVATAFMCIQYLANGGWYVVLKRIFEAASTFLPIGLGAFLIIVLATFAGENHGMNAIYEWMNKDKVAESIVLQGKSGYLNQWFFIARLVLYFGLWILFARKLRANSLAEDLNPGIGYYNKSMRAAATFLPIFGLSFCFASWDWLMSIQPKWYSTIFGVNVFAAAMVATMAIVNITAISLRRKGYMKYVREDHHHDVSKFMFAFSIFWTYTWLSQYLLIWYANLPEETPYYLTRLRGGWKAVFFLNLAVNFVAPLIFLMTRDWKRRPNHLYFMSGLLLAGKFIDWYLVIMPNSAGDTSGFGFLEIGFFMLFAGIFAFQLLSQLSKANLVPKNHPYLDESLHHEIFP